MKYLIILPFLFLACSKQDIRQPKHFGVVGNVDQDYAKFRKGRGKPVKDTVVVTPPDTTTIPIDTLPTVDPVPVLPASYEIQMPTPLNQGGEGSCVSFSVVYAREREQFNKTGSWVSLSQEYLFDQTTINHTSCSGSAVITALNFLQTNGVCTAQSMPYSWYNGCSLVPTWEQNTEAAQYRISDYIQIVASDMTGIKTALLQNHALVTQIAADQAFCDATAGFIWKSLGPVVGYHSLVICGYDDSKHAYKIINSWGTNWGDSGYGWIDYDLFPKVSSSAMKIIL
jgi:C1A family cysteine protease